MAEFQFEIEAFGERIALKRSMDALRQAELAPGFEWLPELPLAVGGVLGIAGLLAWAVRAGVPVLVLRRPGYAGISALLVVVIGLGPVPPVSAGGGSYSHIHWELADPLGSGNVMVLDNGSLLVHRSFTPFGTPSVVAGNGDWLPTHFGGHLWEEDAGLYYMQARWYDAKSGTFLSIDPLVANAWDPQSYNAYAYARNNPASFIDPTGMAAGCLNLLIVTVCNGEWGSWTGWGGLPAPGFGGQLNPFEFVQSAEGIPGGWNILGEQREEFRPSGPSVDRLSSGYETTEIQHQMIFDQEIERLNQETGGAISKHNFGAFDTFAVAKPNPNGTVRAVNVESHAATRGPGKIELLGGTTPGSGQSRVWRSASVGGTFRIDGVAGVRRLTGQQVMRFTILHEYQHQLNPKISERAANQAAWREM